MSWECGECSRAEDDDVRVSWVCHHCGKPLCGEHTLLLNDGAFSSPSHVLGMSAAHCHECRDAHHPLHVLTRRGRWT